MNIAVDCRYIGKSGIGRVCEGILDNLDYDKNKYYLIGKRKYLEKYPAEEIVEDETDPYSFSGLRSFDKRLNKLCDAILIPNFLIPFGIKIPVHSVMHDLIFLDVKQTTRGFKDRTVKKILLKRGIKRSQTVACVSGFTKSRCEHYYGKKAEKCYVNYIGVSKEIADYGREHTESKQNTLVYVGNVKKHKGLPLLLKAFSRLNDGSTLKIIGDKDNFLTGLSLDEQAYKGVEFTGRMDNDKLYSEIQKAKFLVLPSVYEGFGLPPMEALCLGTKPIISDIPVFKEIYSQFDVEFFPCGDVNALLNALKTADPEVKADIGEIENQFNFGKFTKNILERIENFKKR